MSLARLVAFAALASACDGYSRETALPKPEPFIAMERDFQRFREWYELDLEKEKVQGIGHGAGVKRAWVNALPPKGSQRFPVGTIFTRQVGDEHTGESRLFAMAKRGGGYNEKGAPGWEWFELTERADGSTGIRWRGVDAPAGTAYAPSSAGNADDPLGGCNGCHQIAAKNDYVLTGAARLDRP